MSKSHSSNLERLDEMNSRQDYMNDFFDRLMNLIQRPPNLNILRSQSYITMMRKLTIIQDLRSKISKRGNQLSSQSSLSPEDLEELHFIRMLDSGHIDSVWDAIIEFLNQTKLEIDIDYNRI